MSGRAEGAPPELSDAAATLYGTRPEEFVAARGALVKELRAAKARDAAREVATWRRPSVADWGLNLVARRGDAALGAFLDAAATARDAQAGALEGRGGAPDLREAVAGLRSASEAMLRVADAELTAEGRPAGSQLGALTTRLTEVAVTPELAEQLQAGCLGAGTVAIVDLFAGAGSGEAREAPTSPDAPAEPEAAPSPRPRPRSRRSGSDDRSGAAAAPAPAHVAEGERRARRGALEDALRAAEARQATAEADLVAATGRAEAARDGLGAARATLEAARAALEAAETAGREAEDEDAAAAECVEQAEATSRAVAATLAAARDDLDAFDGDASDRDASDRDRRRDRLTDGPTGLTDGRNHIG